MDDHAHDSTPPLWAMLDRYLAGEASATEAATIQGILDRIPNAETILRLEPRQAASELQRITTLAAWDEASLGLDQSWHALTKQLGITDGAPLSAPSESDAHTVPGLSLPSGPQPRKFLPFSTQNPVVRASIAASLAIGAAILGWWGGVGQVESSLATYVSTYATPPGKQATVTLPDGTTLLLNVSSQVQVPGNFMNGNRSVRLTGEALFTVKSHAGNPFVVMTDGIHTKVLGTEFAVRAYPTDSATTVAVRTGKVSVENIVVASGERIRMNSRPETVIPALERATAANFRFVDGVVSLNDIVLGDAVDDLERWYDTQIQFEDDSLKRLRISGEFSAQSIRDLIEVLEGTFKVRVRRSGNAITISKR